MNHPDKKGHNFSTCIKMFGNLNDKVPKLFQSELLVKKLKYYLLIDLINN